jgi:hypothetical protein
MDDWRESPRKRLFYTVVILLAGTGVLVGILATGDRWSLLTYSVTQMAKEEPLTLAIFIGVCVLLGVLSAWLKFRFPFTRVGGAYLFPPRDREAHLLWVFLYLFLAMISFFLVRRLGLYSPRTVDDWIGAVGGVGFSVICLIGSGIYLRKYLSASR